MSTTTETMTAPATDEAQFPLAAQIPLSSFTLPTFPPAASKLRSLTLTSDINLNDYQSTHLQAGTFEPSSTLPSSITHVTLELFSLGFPAPFLTELGKSLPNLQSLTLFSCLIDGLSDASRNDALVFLKTASSTLKELHVVDTFARVGFWKEIGEAFNSASSASDPGLKVLEVSNTYRGHYESDFLNRVPGEEWTSLITPSLVGLSLNFSPPSADEVSEASMQAEKPEDQEDLKAQDGILPFASDGRASVAVRKRFEQLSGHKEGGQGLALKVLNLSMFAMRAAEVGEIAYACAAEDGSYGLVGATCSVLLEMDWFEILTEGLAYKGAGAAIETLEVVGVPVEAADTDPETLLMKSEERIKKLNEVCSKLERFEMTILMSKRIGSVEWTKQDGAWRMERNVAAETS